MRHVISAGLAAVALLTLPGCNDCGTYQYKGVLGTEWCGNVYGTEGAFYEVRDQPEASFAEITFGHSTPPDEFDFDHGGGASLKVLWSDLESKQPLSADQVLMSCYWTDFGDPFDDGDDVFYSEPATELELEGHGARLNLDVGNAFMREVSWNIVCGDGVMRLQGKDKIDFTRLEISLPDSDLMAHVDSPE